MSDVAGVSQYTYGQVVAIRQQPLEIEHVALEIDRALWGIVRKAETDGHPLDLHTLRVEGYTSKFGDSSVPVVKVTVNTKIIEESK